MHTAMYLGAFQKIQSIVALLLFLPQIETGTVCAEQQDESLVTYAAKLEKSEATIDWTESADQIARKVRGMNAWPVAQTLYRGEILRIWRAEAITARTTLEPGTVSCIDKHIDVATGQGVLRLHEIQLPGGKRMSVQAFLSAHNVSGVKLG